MTLRLTKPGRWLTSLVVLVGLGGCGSDPSKIHRPSAQLARPVYPTCLPAGFSRPTAQHLASERGASFWTLRFARRLGPSARPKPETTTTILVAEFSPQTKSGKIKGAPEVNIAGHRVHFRASARPLSSGAQWATRRARYALVANGAETSLVKQLIGCLP